MNTNSKKPGVAILITAINAGSLYTVLQSVLEELSLSCPWQPSGCCCIPYGLFSLLCLPFPTCLHMLPGITSQKNHLPLELLLKDLLLELKLRHSEREFAQKSSVNALFCPLFTCFQIMSWYSTTSKGDQWILSL